MDVTNFGCPAHETHLLQSTQAALFLLKWYIYTKGSNEYLITYYIGHYKFAEHTTLNVAHSVPTWLRIPRQRIVDKSSRINTLFFLPHFLPCTPSSDVKGHIKVCSIQNWSTCKDCLRYKLGIKKKQCTFCRWRRTFVGTTTLRWRWKCNFG